MISKKLNCFILLSVFLNAPTIFAQSTESILQRTDKHFLGGGKMVIWAPEFPLFLDRPGFWDHACFLDTKVEPLFTVTFLDENLKELKLKMIDTHWLPSHLTLNYESTSDLEVQEQRALLSNDVLVSTFSIDNNSNSSRKLFVIVWTCQNIQTNAGPEAPKESRNSNFISSFFNSRSRISWERCYNNEEGKLNRTIGMALGADRYARATAINVSSKTWNYPDWKLTPFFEKMTNSGLPEENNFDWKANPEHLKGLLYAGLNYLLEIPPRETRHISAYCAIGASEQKAIENFDAALKQADPIVSSIANWQEFFDKVPKFNCSDPYLEKYYYYRWYGLRLNMVNTAGKFNLPFPCIFEGINAGWFRHHISYSAPAHMLETRWLHEPEVAMGSLLNFAANQNDDGSFPGAILTGDQEQPVGFYHANWGHAVREVYRIIPNHNFLSQAYDALSLYADYFEQERDKEDVNLYDIQNQWETGQEYMNRYRFADENADLGGSFQLKGVDATVYLYELQKNLSWMAAELERSEDAVKWEAAAVKTYEAILTKMWDDSAKFFVDVHPKTGAKSPDISAVGFYPFMTDLANKTHTAALTEHLFNPKEFWTEYPVPATSLAGPNTNIFGEWKDKRLACPWNGRNWLMTTSHVCEALANFAQHVDASLKPMAVELITRYIQMLYLENDINRPSSYEYYNPVNGQAPYFRGTDDYMHSWIIDLIIKYVVGLQPQDANKILLDPLPFDLESFTLDNVFVKGRLIKILWRKNDTSAVDQGYYIFVDNKLVKKLKQLERFEFELK